jgi:uncharacterized protein DUF1003
MGSWGFVFSALLFLAGWMVGNRGSGFDPYPFILLNLILSCLAALQGAILLIAAKRADQISSDLAAHDYAADQDSEELIKDVRALVRSIHRHVGAPAPAESDFLRPGDGSWAVRGPDAVTVAPRVLPGPWTGGPGAPDRGPCPAPPDGDRLEEPRHRPVRSSPAERGDGDRRHLAHGLIRSRPAPRGDRERAWRRVGTPRRAPVEISRPGCSVPGRRVAGQLRRPDQRRAPLSGR